MINKEISMPKGHILRKKRNRIIIVSVLIYSLFLVGCNNTTSYQDLENYKSENEELKLKITELSKIIESYKDNDKVENKDIINSNSNVKDILHVKELNGTYYIVLRVTDQVGTIVQLWEYTGIPFATLLAEGLDINIETRDPYLYCSINKSISENKYKEEVIKFDNDNNKSLICEGKNVEISASPDGEHFIIIENPETQMELKDMEMQNIRNLKILDINDKIIYDEVIPSKLQTELKPIGWNESEFWAAFNYAGGEPEYLILDIDTLKYEVVENKADRYDSKLNIRTGWICYSDFPFCRDIDIYNDFKQSNKEVNLYLWNLFTDEKIYIATSIAKEFSPTWIDDYTFEYNDPNKKQRLLYKLN